MVYGLHESIIGVRYTLKPCCNLRQWTGPAGEESGGEATTSPVFDKSQSERPTHSAGRRRPRRRPQRMWSDAGI